MNIDPNDPAVRDYVQLIDKIGPPKHRPTGEYGDITSGKCACNKMVALSLFRVFNTGLINAVDNICPGCRHAGANMAIIVCPRCRHVIGRLPAHKDKTGFEFAANRVYHVDCCGVCEPELIIEQQQPTFILEMLRYMKVRGIPVPDQWKNRQYKKPLILLGASS